MTAIRLVPVAVAVAAAALVACTDSGSPVVAPAATPSSSGLSAAASSAAASSVPSAGACPVTVPAPVPASEPWKSQLFGSESAAGNGSLWVGGLPEGGVVRPQSAEVDASGAVSRKFGWWRAVPGALTITGRRLDGSAPPARGDVPQGYGNEGFQSSGVTFPTPGCWEVTGSLETTHLTFVVLVLAP